MTFVGRVQELAAARRVGAAARDGRGAALTISGAAGSGLTSLLRTVAESESDLDVHWVGGLRAERDLGYGALRTLLDPARPDPPHGAASADAAPEVGVELINRLTASGAPALCIVDDAEHLDEPSARALGVAARRCAGRPVSFVVAWHEPAGGVQQFEGLAHVQIGPMSDDEARELLASVAPGPLDSHVQTRLMEEARGNARALVEFAAALTSRQRAGTSALPVVLGVGDAIARRTETEQLAALPAETRRLLVLASTEARLPSVVFWQVAARFGLGPSDAAPAERAGILKIAETTEIENPLLRSTIYQLAPVGERVAAHAALATAIDAALDPSTHARHRAAAALVPDDEIADDLHVLATQARARGAYDEAAGLLMSAAKLTVQAPKAYRRMVAAAQAALAAGAPARALGLLDQTDPHAAGPEEREQTDSLRAAIALALSHGTDRATMLLRAAGTLGSLDHRLGRDTYLEALEAAIFSGRFAQVTTAVEVARLARATLVPVGPEGEDQLLEGVGLLVASGADAAMRSLRRAAATLARAEGPRWLGLAALVALEIFDDSAFHLLATRQIELGGEGERASAAPTLGSLAELDNVVGGRFDLVGRGLSARIETAQSSPRPDVIVAPSELLAAAWRGLPGARQLIDACLRRGFVQQLGFDVALAHHAAAIHELGLGRYEEALASAGEAVEEGVFFASSAAMPDLVEAAVRSGDRALAFATLSRFAQRARASGSDWALGVLARSLALVEEGPQAEARYREAISRLRRSRATPELARAHLVLGEWLRRERRPREAREQLRSARDMFVFMGAQGYAQRARAELAAAGDHASVSADASALGLLTAQEHQIAQFVARGASNAEIASRLYLSPRTVEYHLHKVFRKLGLSSRTQLAQVILDPHEGTVHTPSEHA